MKRTLKIFTLLIILAFVLACGVIVNNEKFNSEKWKRGDARVRGEMAYDLQNSKILLGKTKSQVVELLNKPENPESILNSPTTNHWHFDIDTNVVTDIYFAVHFDETTQKVISTDIGD